VSEATCKTCPAFGPYSYRPEIGTCRLRPPTVVQWPTTTERDETLTHENPEVAASWWCSEHPLRQRDRLAAMAMQATITAQPEWGTADITEFAYLVADAMLAARAKETP
jgi:hypothetical protein